MKKLTIILYILIVCLATNLHPKIATPQENPPTWEVYFSPRGGCTEAIVRELNKAQKTILVQAYKITSTQIAKALTGAHKRGITVQVILDKSQKTDKYSSATFLHNAGITVRIDAQHPIAHDKVMIIDQEIVITGSLNFTKQAEEKNAENLLVIHDEKIASLYTKNWHDHAKHSHIYQHTGR